MLFQMTSTSFQSCGFREYPKSCITHRQKAHEYLSTSYTSNFAIPPWRVRTRHGACYISISARPRLAQQRQQRP